MSATNFQVRLSPSETLDEVRNRMDADLVHEELHTLDDGKQIGTLVFEKYYFRTKNRAALVVITDNFGKVTDVRAVATGSSEGLIFNFDWGAADNFVSRVEEVLQPYLV